MPCSGTLEKRLLLPRRAGGIEQLPLPNDGLVWPDQLAVPPDVDGREDVVPRHHDRYDVGGVQLPVRDQV